jgi:HEPN/RES N-terminal domain 1/RES domain
MGTGNRLIEYSERGYGQVPDKNICTDCLREVTGDSILLDLALTKADEDVCNYCDKEIASTPIEVLIEHIVSTLRCRYDLAAEELPFESLEGGYQGATFDTYGILEDHFDISHDFSKDCVNIIEDETWCEKDPFGLRKDHVMHYSWENFCKLVRHTKRFMFFQHSGGKGDEDIFDPLELLHALEDLIERLELFSEIDVTQSLFRVRPGKGYNTLDALVTPPDIRTTQPNRMNPPGIGMLYAAFDADIAVRETMKALEHPQDYVLAELKLTEPVRVVDLSKLISNQVAPFQPSFFDVEHAEDYYLVPFLKRFVGEISQPIDPSVSPFEYVPTQILTEFFRYGMRSSHLVSGFQYRSAHNEEHETHASLVLFMNHKVAQERLQLFAQTPCIFPSR